MQGSERAFVVSVVESDGGWLVGCPFGVQLGGDQEPAILGQVGIRRGVDISEARSRGDGHAVVAQMRFPLLLHVLAELLKIRPIVDAGMVGLVSHTHVRIYAAWLRGLASGHLGRSGTGSGRANGGWRLKWHWSRGAAVRAVSGRSDPVKMIAYVHSECWVGAGEKGGVAREDGVR